jgi:hypothetical protein
MNCVKAFTFSKVFLAGAIVIGCPGCLQRRGQARVSGAWLQQPNLLACRDGAGAARNGRNLSKIQFVIG